MKTAEFFRYTVIAKNDPAPDRHTHTHTYLKLGDDHQRAPVIHILLVSVYLCLFTFFGNNFELQESKCDQSEKSKTENQQNKRSFL